MTDARGSLLAGRYLLERRLSVSGSGRVDDGDQGTEPSVSSTAWEAQDTKLGTRVFIKLLSADTQPKIVDAHHDLWERLGRHRHSGMPQTLASGVDAGRSFVVTEWADAQTLEDVDRALRQRDFDAEQLIATILWQCLNALDHLHRLGIVHGDISPSNILVSEALDKVWLIDPAPTLPAGRLMTTFAWAAPELRAGHPPTPCSDLYALGKVLQRFAARHDASLPPIVDQMAEFFEGRRLKNAREVLEQIRDLRLGAQDRSETALSADVEAMMRPLEDEAVSQRQMRRLREETEARRLAAERAFLPSVTPRPAASRLGGTVSIGALVASVAMGLGSLAKKVRPTKAKPAPARPVAAEDQNPDAATAQDRPGDWSDRTGIANVPIIGRNQPEPVDADFVVMGPTIVAPGRSFPLELWMGRSSDAGLLRERAQERGVFSGRGSRSKVTLPSHTILTLSMSLPGFTIANPIEHITWDGSIRNAAFILHSNEGLAAGQHWGTLKLLIDAKPLGMISFCVEIGQELSVQPDTRGALSAPMQRFQKAFASYASPDRAEVFKRVQAIRASRVDVFSDIADLRGGERWEDVLMHEIDTRDVFFLFWSRQAAASSWVEREWRRAIDARGVEFICPIPLEDPRVAEPPAELAELHFNDWCLAIIRSEQAMANDGGNQGKS